jgi:hypothetical protein
MMGNFKNRFQFLTGLQVILIKIFYFQSYLFVILYNKLHVYKISAKQKKFAVHALA